VLEEAFKGTTSCGKNKLWRELRNRNWCQLKNAKNFADYIQKDVANTLV